MGITSALPRTRSCGADAKTLEIIRHPKTSCRAQQLDPPDVDRPVEPSPPVHHQAKEGLVPLESQCASHRSGEVGAEEEGYLTMQSIQALLPSSAEDYEYVQRVVRQQLPLFGVDDQEFADGGTPYEEITTPHVESEYQPITVQNVIGNWSENYEEIRFLDEEVRCELFYSVTHVHAAVCNTMQKRSSSQPILNNLYIIMYCLNLFQN